MHADERKPKLQLISNDHSFLQAFFSKDSHKVPVNQTSTGFVIWIWCESQIGCKAMVGRSAVRQEVSKSGIVFSSDGCLSIKILRKRAGMHNNGQQILAFLHRRAPPCRILPSPFAQVLFLKLNMFACLAIEMAWNDGVYQSCAFVTDFETKKARHALQKRNVCRMQLVLENT